MTVMSLDEVANLKPLTVEDKRIINEAKPTPTEDCPEMTAEQLAQFRPWYDRQKQPITLDIDVGIVSYFKRLSTETGVSYQELMRMFLTQCAKEKRKPTFA